MADLTEFDEILRSKHPLGPSTCFGVGGSAEHYALPRSVDELRKLVATCQQQEIPWRVLGAGSNLLVSQDLVPGVVIGLSQPSFCEISVQGQTATAGAGTKLADLIHQTCQASLGGLEGLVGIPGTVGGALRVNAGNRTSDIGQFVTAVRLVNRQGELQTRSKADLRFTYRHSNLDDGVIVSADFELLQDNPEHLVRRIKQIGITRRAEHPFGFQRAGYIFRNPRGLSAAELIEKAGLKQANMGGAELSDRDPTYIIANDDATVADIRSLIDHVRDKVASRTGITLELQINIW